MPIDPLPSISRSDANFRTQVDDYFLTRLPAFSTQAEAARAQIVAAESTTTSAASTAATAATTATTAAGTATSASASAVTAKNAAELAAAQAVSGNVATPIHAATAKTTPADADELGITDSAASWGLKKLTFANLKAWISSLGGAGISNTPSGNISATNVQAAINELAEIKVDLAAATGASLVGFQQGGTGAVSTTVQTVLRETVSVERFGAVGDGVTYDGAAFIAMAAANGGSIVVLDRRYNVNGLNLSGTVISIKGARKPSANAGFTALENGSVLIGNVNIRATTAHVSDFGVDAGSAGGLVSTTEGMVIDAPVGTRGKQATAQNIAVLGSLEASLTHSLLIEGYDENTVDNIDCALRTYGVVVKGRRAHVTRIRAYQIASAPVFIKSDLPASAGNVLDATVQSVTVRGVISVGSAANTTCNHVYVQASTADLTNVIVDDVQGYYGNAAVRIAGGGGAPVASSVQLSNIIGTSGVVGVELFGTTYDTQCNGLRVVNPNSGKAFTTGAASNNWKFYNVDLLISDAAIVGSIFADMSGSGAWNNLTVRNPYRTMTITYATASVIGGQKGIGISIVGEGAPTLAANWTGVAAGYAPLKIWRQPGENVVHVVGSLLPAAGATSIALTLPDGFRPTAAQDFVGVINAAGALGYVRVYATGDVQIPGFVVGEQVMLDCTFRID